MKSIYLMPLFALLAGIFDALMDARKDGAQRLCDIFNGTRYANFYWGNSSIWECIVPNCPKWLAYNPGGMIAWLYRGDFWHSCKSGMLLSWAICACLPIVDTWGFAGILGVPILLFLEGQVFTFMYHGIFGVKR